MNRNFSDDLPLKCMEMPPVSWYTKKRITSMSTVFCHRSNSSYFSRGKKKGFFHTARLPKSQEWRFASLSPE